MIELLLAMLAKPEAKYEPPPELFYHQAVSCATLLKLEVGKKEPSPAQFGDMMTWGMIMADTGRKARRTREQVERGDIEIAEGFYKQLEKMNPKAYAAQRAYCRAIFHDDRP
jgi:hypothetical protein